MPRVSGSVEARPTASNGASGVAQHRRGTARETCLTEDTTTSSMRSYTIILPKEDEPMRRFVGTAGRRLRRLPIAGLALVLSGILAASAGLGGPVQAQTPAPVPAATPVQPWGLPPLPPGVGPVEKFADVSDTPQGKFLEGGAFDSQGNLWFVAIGSGWVSYLTPDGKLVPAFNCNPPPELGQTCEPQGTRWHEGKLYLR